MAALDFPNSPTTNQQYAAPNGVTYQYDGAAWVVTGGPPGQLWTGAGGALTPTDPTKRVAVPGPTASGADQSQLVLGTRSAKFHLEALAGIDYHASGANSYYTGSAWAQDDATKPGWFSYADLGGDAFGIQHMPAGGANAGLFRVQGSDGKTYCTLANASVNQTMLVNGASLRGAGSVSVPVSTTYNTIGAWLTLCTTANITTPGGCDVFLFTNALGWWAIPSATVCNFYWGILRNGSQIIQNQYAGSISGSGGNNVPLSLGGAVFDAPAAGTYNYSLAIYLGAGAFSTGANAGTLSAFLMT